MYNLLIVDDEPFIVEGLAILDWDRIGIKEVYKATSGEEALTVIQENSVDIIITDIRMADMSGLELIKSLGNGQVRKFILLSGYAEFEYAKQAIHLSVSEYLLKPVADEEVMEAVSDAIQSIQKDRHFFQEIMEKIPLFTESELDVIPFDILYEKPQLLDLLDAGNWNGAEEKVKEVFTQLRIEEYQFPEFILQAYFMICNTFTHYSHKNGYLLTDVIGNQIHSMHESAYTASINDLQQVSLEIFAKLKVNFKKEKVTNHQSIVEQVNHYVNINLFKDISLQEVADHVYLHPAYLSKIYKTKTGKSFSDFVFIRKMEESALQLKNSNKKVYLIANEVGYKDPSYFIRKFKEFYGVTPQEYRLQSYAPNVLNDKYESGR